VSSPDATPLELIERAVLEQAKGIRLDLDDEGAKARLRELIEDAVARWSADHRRGLRPHDLADPDLVVERAYRNLVGYGPLEALLEDDDVWEVMINAPDAIFVKRHRGPSGYHDEVFHDDEHVIRTLTKILDDASGAHRKLDPTEGLQDAQLDDGARLHIVHGDVARGGHVMVNIRKFTGVAFRELEQLVDRDMLSVQAAEFLRACARAKLTVVFAGAPGSGKTTLLSCTAAELDPSLRVVVAEEVFEADIPVPNVASMQTRAARADRPAVDLRRLVAGFLRMAPDVAIVGEVRDKEALPLLLTLSSGVKGYTTIHAGSARQALSRLRFICQLADTSSEIPIVTLHGLTPATLHACVRPSPLHHLTSATTLGGEPHRRPERSGTGSTTADVRLRIEHQRSAGACFRCMRDRRCRAQSMTAVRTGQDSMGVVSRVAFEVMVCRSNRGSTRFRRRSTSTPRT
jgi:pilus assembly protein CpaF